MRMIVISVIALALIAAGCEPSEDANSSADSAQTAAAQSAASNGSAKRKKRPEPPFPPVIEVEDDAFADIAQAIDALCKAANDGDNEVVIQATGWLMKQGAGAVPPLAERTLDESAELPIRLATCRVLGYIGEPAVPDLIKALSSGAQLLRINAADYLGRIKVADRDAQNDRIAALVQALDHEDDQTQRRAIRALGRIGPPAKEQAQDRLAGILTEDDNRSLVEEANKALKVIDPDRAAGKFNY